MLRCSNCPVVYVGETELQMCPRIGEYLDEVCSVTPVRRSAFASHFAELDYIFEVDQALLINGESFLWKILALQHIEIVRHNSNDMMLNTFI